MPGKLPWRNALRLARLLAALLIAAAFAGPEPACAHASLIASEPSEGAVVGTKPGAFSLTFNEPISPLAIKLAAPGGTVTDLPNPTVEGPTLTVAAPSKMPAGSYVLSWRVISLDGHPVGGTVFFSLGAPGADPSRAMVTEVYWAVGATIWLTKVLIYCGLFFGTGASLACTFIAPLPSTARSFAIAMAFAGLVAAAASVGLQGLDVADAPIGAFLHPAIWATGFSTTYGLTALIAALALTIGAAAMAAPWERTATLLSIVAAACVGLALSASGHASTAAPQWLTRPAVFLHSISLAFWIGALPPLALMLSQGGAAAAEALARFSRLIPYAIAPLVLSGVALAVVQVGAPAALWSSAYGTVLVAKLLLLAALFGLAGWNRWSLTAGGKAGNPRALQSLVPNVTLDKTEYGWASDSGVAGRKSGL